MEIWAAPGEDAPEFIALLRVRKLTNLTESFLQGFFRLAPEGEEFRYSIRDNSPDLSVTLEALAAEWAGKIQSSMAKPEKPAPVTEKSTPAPKESATTDDAAIGPAATPSKRTSKSRKAEA